MPRAAGAARVATASVQPVMTTSLAAATADREVAEAYSETTAWSANSRPKHQCGDGAGADEASGCCDLGQPVEIAGPPFSERHRTGLDAERVSVAGTARGKEDPRQ